MKKDRNYEDDVKIDVANLDVMCSVQSHLVAVYAEMMNDAKDELETANDYYNLKKSEYELKLRENPEKYFYEWTGSKAPPKITEGAFTSALTIYENSEEDNPLKKAKMDLRKAQKDYRTFQNTIKALDVKGDMLGALIKLQSMNYFSGPRVPHDLTRNVQEYEENLQQETSQIIKRKRKQSKGE